MSLLLLLAQAHPESFGVTLYYVGAALLRNQVNCSLDNKLHEYRETYQ